MSKNTFIQLFQESEIFALAMAESSRIPFAVVELWTIAARVQAARSIH